eukprot:NODE_518_length_1326_cov_273.209867_g373_i0.p1 GENE.NODE_518_length_1326_cov_273.209867_g373_i0~~NODE_518_length_1326_cov_273.209867_g373_i0.p1  ORF type:complete len:338 (-),score=121.02 NODE_518_length_1326_cov_273.209867_g373_i0:154-1167(-)
MGRRKPSKQSAGGPGNTDTDDLDAALEKFKAGKEALKQRLRQPSGQPPPSSSGQPAQMAGSSPPRNGNRASAGAGAAREDGYAAERPLVHVTLHRKPVSIEELMRDVNAKYVQPLWKQYAHRHAVPEELLPTIINDSYFDKQETGLPYLETVYQQAMAHATTIKDNQYFVANFLAPKLSSFLARSGLPEVHPDGYLEYVSQCLKHHYVPAVDVAWSDRKGWGLYAAEDMVLFEYVGLYSGELLFLDADTPESAARKAAGYMYTFPEREKRLVVDSQAVGNYTRLINHDTKHNVFSVNLCINKIPYMLLVSTGAKAGDEILWDYGKAYAQSLESNGAP